MAANAWGVPAVNRRLLPQIQASATALLQREVAVGAVHWLAPTGLIGLTPLACLGPVSVGPGPAEGSSAHVQRLTVAVDTIQSLLQRRVMLTVRAHQARVELVQGPNHSWFGYPEDTNPSARNFVPGASRAGGNGGSSSSSGENPGSGSSSGGGHGNLISSGGSPCSGTSSNGDGTARSSGGISSRIGSAITQSGRASAGPPEACSWSDESSNRVSSAGDTAAAAVADSSTHGTWQRMEEAASRAVQSSSQLQKLADLVIQQVQWAGLDQPLNACHPQGNAVLAQASGAVAGLGMPYLLQQELLQQGCSAPDSRTSQDGGRSNLAEQKQEVARAAADSGGMLGTKLGWPLGQQPSHPPLQPSAEEPPGVAQPQPDGTPLPCRGYPHHHQRVAALNALRLQAGRGYSLCKHGLKQGQGPGFSSTASPQAAMALRAVAGEQHKECSSACSQPRIGASRLQPQLQQLQQGEVQSLKGAPSVHPGRQAVAAPVATQSPGTAGHIGHSAAAHGEVRSTPHVDPEAVDVSQKLGTAATFNKHLRPLQLHSSKLYRASAKHPLERLAARSAVEVANVPSTVPVPAPDGASGEVVAAAAELVMTTEQLRVAVQRINSMPVLAVQRHGQPPLAAGSRHAHSQALASEAVTAVEERRQAWPASRAAIAGVNGIGTLTAPEGLQPSIRVRGSAGGAYMSQVVDPATRRKKGASHSSTVPARRLPAPLRPMRDLCCHALQAGLPLCPGRSSGRQPFHSLAAARQPAGSSSHPLQTTMPLSLQ
jgi:hypothetical protein